VNENEEVQLLLLPVLPIIGSQKRGEVLFIYKQCLPPNFLSSVFK